jgi:Citrate synthase, C-terminal domain
MSDAKPVTSVGGLRGQSAGSTAICTVGKEGIGLTYRGYHIDDLAENATFEEVAYLLLKGTLPNWQELDDFKKRLKGLRSLQPVLARISEGHPTDGRPPYGHLNAWRAGAGARFRAAGCDCGAVTGKSPLDALLLVSLCSPNAGAAAVLDGLNRLVQAAEALLAGRPDPQTR